MFGDISKTFGRSFLVAHLLPAGLLCSVAVLLLEQRLIDASWLHDGYVFAPTKPVLLLVVIFCVAIVLSLLSKQLTRIYEGYSKSFFLWYAFVAVTTTFANALYARSDFLPRWPVEWLLLISAAISGLLAALHTVSRRRQVQLFLKASALTTERYRLVRDYPQDHALILATRFGNILRAFEHYPVYMFGIEPITTWFRLFAVIPDSYKTQLENAEAATQFFLNLSAIFTIFAGWPVYVALRQGTLAPVAGALPIAALSYGMYRFACANARDWGEQVRSAFDLYRFDLLKQLRVATPERRPWSLVVERTIWQRVLEVTFYSDPHAKTHFGQPLQDNRYDIDDIQLTSDDR